MSEHDQRFQEQRLDEILTSSADDASKTQHITDLGFDPEIAEEIVKRHHLNTREPLYYETLDFADLDDLDDTDEENGDYYRKSSE